MRPRAEDSTDYFTACIRYQAQRAAKLTEQIRAAAPDEPHLLELRRRLFTAQQKKFTAMYSRGDALAVLLPEFTSLSYSFLRNWQPDAGSSSGYADALRFASLAVLFGADAAMREAVRRRISDSLTDALLCAEIPVPDPASLRHGEFRLLAEAAQQRRAEQLCAYMEIWYHRDRYDPWYSSHGLNEDCGKWSFAAAAIAKRYAIPDAALRDDPHYPYELAHFVP
ncbi:MAG TPA: hypothetical protein DDX71_03755 [Ruminococcus sp.]|nr:hypothetical protein [Ruminococcus sp.]